MDSRKSYSKIIAKTWSDPKFKERLLKDPEAILKENGIEMPKGKKIQIHENTNKVIHFVIPEKPSAALSMKDLEAAAAAGCGGGCSPCKGGDT